MANNTIKYIFILLVIVFGGGCSNTEIKEKKSDTKKPYNEITFFISKEGSVTLNGNALKEFSDIDSMYTELISKSDNSDKSLNPKSVSIISEKTINMDIMDSIEYELRDLNVSNIKYSVQ